MSGNQRLFVYGTLAPGKANHDVIENIPGTWEPGTLRGRLLEEGWGATMGFPGIVPTPDGEEIEGFIFSSKELAAHWPRLDAFEGSGYKRVLASVKVKGSHEVMANVYALNQNAQHGV